MSDAKKCPRCGTELPADAPAGICPKCLMAAGLASDTGGQATPSGEPTAPLPGSSSFVPPEPGWLAVYFPQLEILELLGHGGMGAVYKARQPRLDRLVALKIIRPEAAQAPAFAERFNREARMLARLSHPHIVAVYDFGEVSVSNAATGSQPRQLYFFLMEYVDGVNLRQLMQAGELTPQQSLAIVPQICEALQFAHDEGVVHRDIKPENILLDKRGRVKIADFGLAKLIARSPEEFTLTGTHQVMGTPRYMAPEQMEGSHAIDHRADIFSLGVVFYEMLTGEVPAGHFEPPSKRVEIDVRLDEIVLRSLAREPERRYQHASDVKTDVESISQTPVTGADAPSGVVEAAPRFSRKAVLGACAVALSVAASILGLVTGAIVLELQHGRLNADARGGPPVQWWEYPIMFTLGVAFLSGLVAPFAATILGIVAMREIKDSNGRLVGLGLAFFDAVFFPVLVINAVILAVCFLPAAYIGIAAGMDEEAASVLLPLLLVALPVDFFLIRWWWRAAVRDRQLTASGTLAKVGTPVAHVQFSVPATKDIASRVVFHFSGLGYRIVDERPNDWVFVRRTTLGSLWAFDIRKIKTTLTVRTINGDDGRVWVSCHWAARTFGTTWITRGDVAKLEAEARELQAMLEGDVTDDVLGQRRYQHASGEKTELESISSSRRPAVTLPATGHVANRGDDASSKILFKDFLLMNPRLPVAAGWITVYAIVVRPVLWTLEMLLLSLGFESSLAGEHAEAALDHVIEGAAGLLGLVFVVTAAIGGVKLRAMGHAGPRWIKIGLGLGCGFWLLVTILALAIVPRTVEILRYAARTNPEQLIAEGWSQQEIAVLVAEKKEYPILIPDVIGAFLAVLWLALDVAAFVWLWRNSRFLPLSDARALPAVPIADKPRGVLGRAWDDWWAERDRWVAKVISGVLLIIALFSLVFFFGPHIVIQWRPVRHVTVELGPAFSPWFRSETDRGWHDMSSWSWVLVPVAFLA